MHLRKIIKAMKKSLIIILIIVLVIAAAAAILITKLPHYVDGIEYQINDDGTASVCGVKKNLTIAEIHEEYKGRKVTYIDEAAFALSMVESVTMPDSIIEIRDEAFIYCDYLKEIKLSNNLKSIGKEAFRSDSSLEEIDFPESLEIIANEAFTYCGLKNVKLPVSLTDIGYDAFGSCESLVKVELAPNADYKTVVGPFVACSALEEVIIPPGLTNISAETFRDCDQIKNYEEIAAIIEANAKKNALPEAIEVALWDAYDKGLLTVEIIPGSIRTTSLRFENNSNYRLRIDYSNEKTGYYLKSPSDETQNMLVTGQQVSTRKEIINPGGHFNLEVYTACMNIHREIPDSKNTGYIFEDVDNEVLLNLITIFKEESTVYSVRQAAVWIVTDDASFEDTGILQYSMSGRVIKSEDYDKAVELVERAKENL